MYKTSVNIGQHVGDVNILKIEDNLCCFISNFFVLSARTVSVIIIFCFITLRVTVI